MSPRALEAEQLLRHFGAETRVFDPRGRPLPDGAEIDHSKVHELRELSLWSEGQVWTSPERHGAMSGIEGADRLDSAGDGRCPADAGPHTCGHADLRRIAVV